MPNLLRWVRQRAPEKSLARWWAWASEGPDDDDDEKDEEEEEVGKPAGLVLRGRFREANILAAAPPPPDPNPPAAVIIMDDDIDINRDREGRAKEGGAAAGKAITEDDDADRGREGGADESIKASSRRFAAREARECAFTAESCETLDREAEGEAMRAKSAGEMAREAYRPRSLS